MTMPSRKWFAALVTGLTGLALLVVQEGAWTAETSIMAITILSARALAYLVPNESGEVTD